MICYAKGASRNKASLRNNIVTGGFASLIVSSLLAGIATIGFGASSWPCRHLHPAALTPSHGRCLVVLHPASVFAFVLLVDA